MLITKKGWTTPSFSTPFRNYPNLGTFSQTQAHQQWCHSDEARFPPLPCRSHKAMSYFHAFRCFFGSWWVCVCFGGKKLLLFKIISHVRTNPLRNIPSNRADQPKLNDFRVVPWMPCHDVTLRLVLLPWRHWHDWTLLNARMTKMSSQDRQVCMAL